MLCGNLKIIRLACWVGHGVLVSPRSVYISAFDHVSQSCTQMLADRVR
jgi:hypothetical protein